MLCLFGLSINNAGSCISRDRMILSLVDFVAVAVSAIRETFPTLDLTFGMHLPLSLLYNPLNKN